MARTSRMQFCEICHNRDILQLGITFYRALNHGISAEAQPYYECKHSDKIENVLHGPGDTRLVISIDNASMYTEPPTHITCAHHGASNDHWPTS